MVLVMVVSDEGDGFNRKAATTMPIPMRTPTHYAIVLVSSSFVNIWVKRPLHRTFRRKPARVQLASRLPEMEEGRKAVLYKMQPVFHMLPKVLGSRYDMWHLCSTLFELLHERWRCALAIRKHLSKAGRLNTTILSKSNVVSCPLT